jgi:hypothetical protein
MCIYKNKYYLCPKLDNLIIKKIRQMKVFSKLLMFTLVLSVFAGCSKDKDDDNLPIEGVAGKYEGTLSIVGMDAIPNVTINITYSDNTVLLSIPAGTIPAFPLPIDAPCTVTSDKDKYSLSGAASVSFPVSEDLSIPIPVTIEDTSNITKAGKAVFDIKVALPVGIPLLGGTTLVVTFEGQKK